MKEPIYIIINKEKKVRWKKK